MEVGDSYTFTTIGEALRFAGNGDTVRIFPGTYREGNLRITKSLMLEGIGYPTLDGQLQGEVLTITTDSVVIRGLRIANVGTSYTEDRAGIRIEGARNFRIENNLLENTFFGIYLARARDGVISGNRVYGEAINEMSSGNAIHLWKCSRVIVTGNHVTRHRDGIYFEFVDKSQVSRNTSEENLRYGLHFMFSNNDAYHGNVFARNGAGVAVMFSREIDMHDNTFERNWGNASYGLLLKEISDAQISGNSFTGNSIAVYAEGSSRIRFGRNIFKANGWAFKISGGCLDMVITENNFIGNTFDISLNSAVNNNDFSGNYWSGYAGYDLDRDGTGDVPYRPVKLFNYILQQTPETIVLLRSLFVDILNFSEKVNPILTPKHVLDNSPLMNPLKI